MAEAGLQAARWTSAPGGLDDPRWLDVPASWLVDVLLGGPPRWATSVRLATSPEALAVRFTCAADTVRATMTRYKDKVWQEDAVEVYLQPAGSPVLYELQLSPIGTFRDLQVWSPERVDRRYDDSWSCTGAQVRARINRSADHAITGWDALFVLPWAPMGGLPGAGARIALFRIERDPEEHTGLVSCPADEIDLHDPRLLVPLRL